MRTNAPAAPMTTEELTTLDLLTRALAHAPSIVGTRFENTRLRGWWVGPGFWVCSSCAGRLMARGYVLPEPTRPVWRDEDSPYGVCVGCEPPSAPGAP